jgi:hypothetical protein
VLALQQILVSQKIGIAVGCAVLQFFGLPYGFLVQLIQLPLPVNPRQIEPAAHLVGLGFFVGQKIFHAFEQKMSRLSDTGIIKGFSREELGKNAFFAQVFFLVQVFAAHQVIIQLYNVFALVMHRRQQPFFEFSAFGSRKRSKDDNKIAVFHFDFALFFQQTTIFDFCFKQLKTNTNESIIL